MIEKLAKKYRRDIVDMLVAAGRGHVGSAFSIVEVLAVLHEHILRFDAKNPKAPHRDRLILSKGHGCMALYAVLADKGFFPKEELLKFCKPEGILGGHPDHRKIPGIETSTGSLGHGLPIGVGMAVSARWSSTPYRVFVIVGDGECNEGTTWESALSASKHGLDNLVVLVDYNKMQSYSFVKEVLDLEPFADKWRAFGFAVREVDMHDPKQLKDLLLGLPFEKGRPNAVICHSIKGKGVSFAENNASWHHKNKLTEEELSGLREALKD